MKYLNLLLFFFLLSSLYLCQESNSNKDYNSTENIGESNSQEVFGELRQLREKNNKKYKEKLHEYLKELGLESQQLISREDFKKIFFKLFELGNQEVREEEKKKGMAVDEKEGLTINKAYVEKIFNNLISIKREKINVDGIIKFFEPGNIIFALKDTVDVIGLDNNLSDDILHTLDAISEKNKKKDDEKQTDL